MTVVPTPLSKVRISVTRRGKDDTNYYTHLAIGEMQAPTGEWENQYVSLDE